MKANFKLSKTHKIPEDALKENKESSNLSPEEFEDFIIKSGAAGSFMIFRSDKKEEDELGLDEL